MRMKKVYQLVKLKTSTVHDLKRLMAQTGKGGLDELIISMIQITDEYRLNMKNAGWCSQLKRG